jgi:hypothetical protein
MHAMPALTARLLACQPAFIYSSKKKKPLFVGKTQKKGAPMQDINAEWMDLKFSRYVQMSLPPQLMRDFASIIAIPPAVVVILAILRELREPEAAVLFVKGMD